MKTITLFLMLAVVGTCLADAPPFKPGLGKVETPVGRLGYKIGNYLTIEGARPEGDKGHGRVLQVDTINGYKLDKPVTIQIENVDLPASGRCVLKGYETGKWTGTPSEVLRATEAKPRQPVWQFEFHFIVTSVDQPKGLTVKKKSSS